MSIRFFNLQQTIDQILVYNISQISILCLQYLTNILSILYSTKKMYNQAQIQQNQLYTQNQLKFTYKKVHEVWQCKLCKTNIYRKQYPFDNVNNYLRGGNFRELLLDNVKIDLNYCADKVLEIGAKKRKLKVSNCMKVYCSTCRHEQLLGQFNPQIHEVKNRLQFQFIPNEQNMVVIKIVTILSNEKELQQKRCITNIFKKRQQAIPTNKSLQVLQRGLQNYISMWMMSFNFDNKIKQTEKFVTRKNKLFKFTELWQDRLNSHKEQELIHDQQQKKQQNQSINQQFKRNLSEQEIEI